MTERLERAVARAAELPADRQDALAALLLDEIDAATDAGSLRGSVRHYDDPFEPAADADDWEAA